MASRAQWSILVTADAPDQATAERLRDAVRDTLRGHHCPYLFASVTRLDGLAVIAEGLAAFDSLPLADRIQQ